MVIRDGCSVRSAVLAGAVLLGAAGLPAVRWSVMGRHRRSAAERAEDRAWWLLALVPVFSSMAVFIAATFVVAFLLQSAPAGVLVVALLLLVGAFLVYVDTFVIAVRYRLARVLGVA